MQAHKVLLCEVLYGARIGMILVIQYIQNYTLKTLAD